MIIVRVSGKTYSGALDPDATAVPDESGWPKPARRKVGKGYQYRYDLTVDQAEHMAEHLECLAECFITGNDDPFSHAEGRACAKDAARIRVQLQTDG